MSFYNKNGANNIPLELNKFKSRVVNIGDISLGGNYPIRIQSMTSTNTMDTQATVEQSIRMINAGCEYVRITAQGINEAENLKNIKKELNKHGYNVPLIADIHFNPKAAEVAAEIVEKVRINPGNYVDRNTPEKIKYTDSEYKLELEKIGERLYPLIKICKEYGTAIRIGTNHGSLSERIMSRYGDTPNGMVESAFEFVRICQDFNFFDIVLSMKASNINVMVQAYRLLVSKMIEHGMDYPIHLGVTEAGDGEDGRIKSAAGIGALLEDGIGDTIRVSLTEDPEFEMPVAKEILKNYPRNDIIFKASADLGVTDYLKPQIINPFEYIRRKSYKIGNIGGDNVPVVISNNFSENSDYYKINIKNISDKSGDKIYPVYTVSEYLQAYDNPENPKFIILTTNKIVPTLTELINKIKSDKKAILIFDLDENYKITKLRHLFFQLIDKKCNVPVIIKRKYKNLTEEELLIRSSIDFSTLLLDGLGDGIWIDINKKIMPETINKIALGILQATRTRISKTEYIACPSCGRTLFDIQEALNKVREKTNHLKGLKIAVMGCIVNGPGEMADADYGYVGSGKGKITLYKGKKIVKKNINENYAINALIELIKENGDWIEV
jgi:(E)-4-hydroxy-3-methylbut-2-enyl-diphosphate synthase